MSEARIFILGATGYIGAAAFDLIYAKHPEYRFTALVRSNEKAAELAARYPLVRTVIGDGSNLESIQSEATNASIVISTLDFFVPPF